MRTTEEIKTQMNSVSDLRTQQFITNELLLDIRNLLMAHLETTLERQAKSKEPLNEVIEASDIPPFDPLWQIVSLRFQNERTDYYHLNAEGFNKHGQLPIDVLSLGARAKGILGQARITYVHEFRYYRRSELYRLRNSGKLTLEEIDNCLAKYNIFLPE